MKNLRTLIALTVVAFLATFISANAAGSFDSDTATIKKDGKMAKVMIKKDSYVAPISFEDGADWSAVKDHYEVDPSVVSGLAKHKIAIKVGADGKASFTKKK